MRSFPCPPPPPGKAGPTLPRALCVFPSEELGFLPPVHVRRHLPTHQSVDLYRPRVCKARGFFCSSFLAFASPSAPGLIRILFLPVPFTRPAPLPASRPRWMNGFCNSSFLYFVDLLFLLFFL